jgi:hypothetical protein
MTNLKYMHINIFIAICVYINIKLLFLDYLKVKLKKEWEDIKTYNFTYGP